MRVGETEIRTYIYDFIIEDELVYWKPKPEDFVRIQIVGSENITWKTWIGTSRTWEYVNDVWTKNGVVTTIPELEIFYQKSIRERKLKRILNKT
jgi:hypothetical protein